MKKYNYFTEKIIWERLKRKSLYILDKQVPFKKKDHLFSCYGQVIVATYTYILNIIFFLTYTNSHFNTAEVYYHVPNINPTTSVGPYIDLQTSLYNIIYIYVIILHNYNNAGIKVMTNVYSHIIIYTIIS